MNRLQKKTNHGIIDIHTKTLEFKMIVNAEIQIKDCFNPNLTAEIARHPSIVERSAMLYSYSKGNMTINTRLQIEATTLSLAELILCDSLTIDEGEDISVDEESLPTILLTEVN